MGMILVTISRTLRVLNVPHNVGMDLDNVLIEYGLMVVKAPKKKGRAA
jgi:hypothetical protein